MGNKEFNLDNERRKWFDKWMGKRLTFRAIAEFKQTDKEFIKRLEKGLFDLEEKTSKETGINPYNVLIDGNKVREIIEKLAGEKLC